MEQRVVSEKIPFSRYQILLVLILTVLQFTHAVDFMIISPLGAMLIRLLDITPARFGFVVSAYTFSAGIASLITATFADRYDRKKLVLWFYSGFIIGTFLCGLAPTYEFLVVARIIAGAFGGVLFALTLTIVADVFPQQVRGRVMGIIQMSFSVSQIAGIPLGLYVANNWGWHMPFRIIGVISIAMLFVVAKWVRPIDGHLKNAAGQNIIEHLKSVVRVRPYLVAFAVMVFLSLSVFMLVPYLSTFLVYNVGLRESQLPLLYLIAGISGIVVGPFAGKLSDSIGPFKVFFAASVLTAGVVAVLTHLPPTVLVVVACVNTGLVIGVTGRMVSASALLTSVPDPQDRGAFMSINSSVQQIAAGFAAMLGGIVVHQRPDKILEGVGTLGFISVALTLSSIAGVYIVYRYVVRKSSAQPDTARPDVVK